MVKCVNVYAVMRTVWTVKSGLTQTLLNIMTAFHWHRERHHGISDGFHFQLARQTALEVNICVTFNGDASNLLISVKGFGIIGGGAVLFSASALAGQTILPFLGETFFICVCHPCNFEMILSETFHIKGLGAVATTIGGGAVTRAMCSTPWCT